MAHYLDTGKLCDSCYRQFLFIFQISKWSLQRQVQPTLPPPPPGAWNPKFSVPLAITTTMQSLKKTKLRVLSLRANYADRATSAWRCHVVCVTDPYHRILGFLDRNCYFFFQAARQLYSRGWVDPVPDPLLLRKSGIAGNWTWTSGSVDKNPDH
jgi:hypothetical protein